MFIHDPASPVAFPQRLPRSLLTDPEGSRIADYALHGSPG
jgi:hypothetical protein